MVSLKVPHELKGYYGVITSGGRPEGTTAEEGYGVSPGRLFSRPYFTM